MHISVLLKETIDLLKPEQGNHVIDGTLGLGGHALHILPKIGSEGHYYGFDLDEENMKSAQERLSGYADQLTFIHDNFAHCNSRLQEIGVHAVDRILLDLGLSSPHVDEASRGFSFKQEGPLDMRFDRSKGITAEYVLNRYSEEDLKKIFYEYGEERYAPKITRMILERRREQPFKMTTDLTGLIDEIMKNPKDKRLVATRVFQALRIEVNDELSVLRESIPMMLDLLAPGGRLVIMSYHSLEDRIVKHTFRDHAKNGPFTLLTKKPIVPTEDEIKSNPRSRSAKLRGIEKNL